MSRTPLHLVTGFLGSGKTSLLLDQIAKRRGLERCAVLVNDFGEARIDASLLDGRVALREIPGGCVCCTAPEDLVPAIQALLDEVVPDRIFLEATGLARPSDILDTLGRSALKERLMLAPVVVVVDPRRLVGMAPALVLEQMDAADILVSNWSDQADIAAHEAMERHAKEHFPPWLAVVEAQKGAVAADLFDLRRPGPSIRARSQGSSTAGYAALSQTWDPTVVFSQKAVAAALRRSDTERVKGLFNTELGWTLMERAGGAVHQRPSGLRSLSAVDVIVHGDADQARALLKELDDARHQASEQAQGELRLSDAQGYDAHLNRWSLAALPGQVHDISEQIPQRQGSAVLLSEVVGLLHPMRGAKVVLVAGDGMLSGPTPVNRLGGALIVHSLDGGPFPLDKGGPFRVLVPPADGQSACANVKQLVRIELVER